MNKHIWSGVVIWGVVVTGFGLGAMSPAHALSNSFASAAPDQESIFLLAGGIVSCFIGLIGMIASWERFRELTEDVTPQCGNNAVSNS